MSKFRVLNSSIALWLLGSAFVACGGTSPEDDIRGETEAIAIPVPVPLRTETLLASADARTQLASSMNFGNDIKVWTNVPNAHWSYIKFPLFDFVPPGAVIEHAELKLHFNGLYAGSNETELGRVEGDWVEDTIIWDNQPGVTWSGLTVPVGDAEQELEYDVTDLVGAWQSGARPNYGFAIRSTENGGKMYWSREHGGDLQPRLVITYSMPEPPGPRPDLGDAPDTSNGVGVANTAYPIAGVLGQFPTVFNVPVGQAAGPRHANDTVQATLGLCITAEQQAQIGPDQDPSNNILRNPAGMLGDFSNNDRCDNGWLNRNIPFPNCTTQTLQVRVAKPLGATQPLMYLNVYFDGNRTGAWGDVGLCILPNGVQPNSEWIVQNQPINMALVPAGGFNDFAINTVRILNTTEGLPHWMRFTLSETPVPNPAGAAQPDGRGPHPSMHPGGWKFGETEDYFQDLMTPPPPTSL